MEYRGDRGAMISAVVAAVRRLGISAVRQLEIDQVGGWTGVSREVGATASLRVDENAVVRSLDRQTFDQLTKTQAALTPALVEHAS
jgi:hypothetical protein